MTPYEQGIEKAALILWRRLIVHDPNDPDGGPTADYVMETAGAAIEAFLSVQPTAYWCEPHDKPSTDMECDENGMGQRACRIIEQRRVSKNEKHPDG